MTLRAREVLTHQSDRLWPFAVDKLHLDGSIRETEGRFERVDEAPGDIRADHKPVDDDINIVLLCLRELRW